MGCMRPSRNLDTFSVGAPQFEMTCLPGTFDSRLWILARDATSPGDNFS